MGKKEMATGAQRAPVYADLTPHRQASSSGKVENGECQDQRQQQWPEAHSQDC